MLANADRPLDALRRLLALASALVMLSACVPKTADGLCHASSDCEAGVCVRERCRGVGDDPAPVESRRVVLDPTKVVLVVDDDPDATRSSTLLVAFDTRLSSEAQIRSAFLVLPELPSETPIDEPMMLSTADILEPWAEDAVGASRLPKRGAETGASRVTPGGGPVRVDVTEAIQRAQRQTIYGLSLRATGVPLQPDLGIRLELYLL